MLLFRSEEHVERWCRQWNLPRGAVMPLEQAWRLAHAWFSADRGALEWHRPPVDQIETVFAAVGLSGPFWSLR